MTKNTRIRIAVSIVMGFVLLTLAMALAYLSNKGTNDFI